MADEVFQVLGIVTQGVQRAQQAADTGSHHHVHRKVILFQVLEDAHGSGTLGTAAGKDQRHRRTRLPDLGHPVANLTHSLGILGIQAEGRVHLFLLRKSNNRKEEQEDGNQFLHDSLCLPANKPQAAKISSPRDARMVAVRPPAFNLSRKASITGSGAVP